MLSWKMMDRNNHKTTTFSDISTAVAECLESMRYGLSYAECCDGDKVHDGYKNT